MKNLSPDGAEPPSITRAEATPGDVAQRLRVALANSPTAVAEQDLDLRYTWVFNPKLGYDADEIVGRTDFELLDPASAERLGKLKRSVIETGRPARDRIEVSAPERPREIYDVYVEPSVDTAGRIVGVITSATDITYTAAAMSRLRESEALLGFVLKLSDALRDIADPTEVQQAAQRFLGEHLGAMRVGYAEDVGDGVHVDLTRDWTDGAPSLAGRYRYADYGEGLTAALHAGRTLARPDIQADARLSSAEKAAHAALGLGATLNVPLARQGRCLAILAVHYAGPHEFTPQEIALAEATAERTWAAVERARAERARIESEARFTQFAAASNAGLWIRDAATLALEYASPALAKVYGFSVPPREVAEFAELILPEDRQAAVARAAQARRGNSYVHEFRIHRADDGARRWLRATVFPLRDSAGEVTRIGGFTEDVTVARRALERQAVLAAELQHRVRNTMALIRSLVIRTAERAETVADFADRLTGRLLALSRVQTRLTRESEDGVTVAEIVREETAALMQPDGRLRIDGPPVSLGPKAAEALTLALHELATNAVKYGALSSLGGEVVVQWRLFEKGGVGWLGLDWRECGVTLGAPARPFRRGFGTELIEQRIPYELGGSGRLALNKDGLDCRLEFPLKSGASVLDTRAPSFVAREGDNAMTEQPSLDGRRVLVVEDDYYLADDLCRALREYGAEIVGPCADADAALAALETTRPHVAAIDVNLGDGANFRVANLLKQAGLPFVFMTGYDADMIPTAFAGVARLEKPVEMRWLVEALAAALKG